MEVYGGGNFRRSGVGFSLGFRVPKAKGWAVSLCGVVGGIAGDLGEIGEGILGCSGGVLDAGLLGEAEAEVGCSWVDFGEGMVTLSLGIVSGKRRLSSG